MPSGNFAQEAAEPRFNIIECLFIEVRVKLSRFVSPEPDVVLREHEILEQGVDTARGKRWHQGGGLGPGGMTSDNLRGLDADRVGGRVNFGKVLICELDASAFGLLGAAGTEAAEFIGKTGVVGNGREAMTNKTDASMHRNSSL